MMDASGYNTELAQDHAMEHLLLRQRLTRLCELMEGVDEAGCFGALRHVQGLFEDHFATKDIIFGAHYKEVGEEIESFGSILEFQRK